MIRWVVVGGGAAGCVVADRLSERDDADVVLLEAGPDHGSAPVSGDVGPFFADQARVATEWVSRRPGRAAEPYRQGVGLGGSSLINGSVVTRPRRDGCALPLVAPWALGAVGSALLATDPRAHPVGLVRDGTARLTAADLFVRTRLDRPNLAVRCGTRVDTVRLAGRRAVGVRLDDGSSIDADRVVLCAGAIRTPTILLRSGIDTPGIGEGLQDHPAFAIALALREPAIDATAPTIAVAAVHRRHQVIALNHLPDAPELGALTVSVLDVHSEGRVSIDADGRPRVELRQFDDARDRDALVAGVGETMETLEHDAWRDVVADVFVDEFGTRPADLVDDAFARHVLDRAGGHHHVAASCRDGVVSDGGVLRGYDALYVADASALPRLPRVDPYLAVVEQAGLFAAEW